MFYTENGTIMKNRFVNKFFSRLNKRLFIFLRIVGLEALIWISALFYLAFFNDPFHQHFTICPLSNAGFEYCPGCGLGNSISLLLNGYISESFNAHYFGFPAAIILLYRIFFIIRFNLKKVNPLTKTRSSYA